MKKSKRKRRCNRTWTSTWLYRSKTNISLIHEMKRRNEQFGIVTMCIGGGMGAAGVFELL